VAGESLDAVLREARRLASPSPEPAGPARTVLIVDDIADHRAICALGLRALGFGTHEAADGTEAVAKAIAHQPDAIVMDFAMPGADGGQAVRRLLADERTRDIPVLMLSAFAERVPHDVRTRCAGFLSKPCDCDKLGGLLHLLVDLAQRKQIHRGGPAR